MVARGLHQTGVQQLLCVRMQYKGGCPSLPGLGMLVFHRPLRRRCPAADGKNYTNTCFAQLAGVPVSCKSTCPCPGECRPSGTILAQQAGMRCSPPAPPHSYSCPTSASWAVVSILTRANLLPGPAPRPD